jgi:hypothetical protein
LVPLRVAKVMSTVGAAPGDNGRYFMDGNPLTYAANPHT